MQDALDRLLPNKRPHLLFPQCLARSKFRAEPAFSAASSRYYYLRAWDECAQILQSHSDQMIARWKAEIDMLLVFAGLFSAVLTAFNVQSYVLLQPDTAGASLLVLTQISTQLSSFTATPTAINSTRPAFVLPPDSSFKPPPSAVWINALWFSSLICTLSASSLAIMVKQWLHQYDEGLSGTSRNVTRLRQYRYGNLLKWRIVGIIALIPVHLQASLALFLAGLVILLWTIHPAVATVISVLAGLLLLFIIFSTVIPTFRADCPYQSPQALSIYIASQFVARIMARMASILSVKVACLLEPLEIRHG
ncbi:hypothetical protein BD311DRAFT_777242 [Dichomitus squalens]|uniref:DUF6535 domain-containing protein n=1 Tax=Dichomitus squalens TaxID=114155 RepID=A0A4Q9MQH8_9APHY|nr:hypothetical protein BD311DRAFT_777242 [Dichomitus squalens]